MSKSRFSELRKIKLRETDRFKARFPKLAEATIPKLPKVQLPDIKFPKIKPPKPTILIVVDLIGIIGVISCSAFYHYGHQADKKDEELFSLWGNLSTELIGGWFSVKVISAVIAVKENHERARLTTIRNLRYLLRVSRDLSQHWTPNVHGNLIHELRYSERMLESRKRRFSEDELHDISEFFDSVGLLAAYMEAIIKRKNLDFEQTTNIENELESMIEGIVMKLEIAEENVLEETPEK